MAVVNIYQAERERIGEFLWEILTHNTDVKHPMEKLIEMVDACNGNQEKLAWTLLESFREAASYMGIREPEFVEDPVVTAFRGMAAGIARANSRK